MKGVEYTFAMMQRSRSEGELPVSLAKAASMAATHALNSLAVMLSGSAAPPPPSAMQVRTLEHDTTSGGMLSRRDSAKVSCSVECSKETPLGAAMAKYHGPGRARLLEGTRKHCSHRPGSIRLTELWGMLSRLVAVQTCCSKYVFAHAKLPR